MERSIDFDDDELADLAALVTDHPPVRLRVGRDRRAGRRSLIARNIVQERDDGSVHVNAAVHRLVEICCRPTLVCELHRGEGGAWGPDPKTFTTDGAAAVEHEVIRTEDRTEGRAGAATHRLTPFHATDVVVRLAEQAGITDRPAPPSEATVELARSARVAVGATVDRPGSGRQGIEVAWVDAVDGYWEIPAERTPLAGSAASDLGGGFEPVSGAHLVGRLEVLVALVAAEP